MLVVFIPKENLYYFALEKLNTQKVDIQTENIVDSGLVFNLVDNEIQYEKIDVAQVEDVELKLFFLKTELNFKDIIVNKAFQKFLPKKIKYIKITHNILDPLAINIVVSKKLNLRYQPLTKYLKKTENGYRYEYKF